MTVDDTLKAGLAFVLSLLSGGLAWLLRVTLSNREDIAKWKGDADAEIALLKTKLTALEGAQMSHLTREDVREIVEAVLDKRDTVAAALRTESDRRLALEIKQAVIDGADKTKRELEEAVPRIVRETLYRTGALSRSNEVPR